MFLAANPDKCRTAEEQEELKKKCSIKDNLFLKIVGSRQSSREERQAEEADRTLVDEVRQLSLREAGLESSDARRERHREEDSSSHTSGRSRGRDTNRHTRAHEERNRERRHQREEHGLRHGREHHPQSGEIRHMPRQNNEERVHSNRRATASRVEHQSSLRSLISAPNVDSHEMEEEILRQIREEGLLDGIDLEHIDVSQENEIEKRIVQAFQRWQSERTRSESTDRAVIFSGRGSNIPSPESLQTHRENSARASNRRRSNHNRTPSSTSQNSQQSRPPQSISAMQAAQLDENSINDGRRRTRHINSNNRNFTDSSSNTRSSTGSAVRSVSDPRDRPRQLRSATTWSATSESSRSSTDLVTPQTVEFATGETRTRHIRIRSSSNPRSRSTSLSDIAPTGESRNHEESTVHGPLFVTTLSSCTSVESNLVPAPLFPQRMLLDRANILSSGSRPASTISQNRLPLFSEPFVNCARCARRHIEYEWHYNCNICSGGHYNICLSCYRSGHGCLHWLGIGPMAWKRWENLKQSSRTKKGEPHTLTPCRYLLPNIPPGGADGRRTLTTENPQKRLQSGTFCASCFAWTNECYWRCDTCNEGDWGFCNTCVNQGRSCTHPIMPLSFKPPDNKTLLTSPTPEQKRPASAVILTGPGVMEMGPFKPLIFSARCDICRYPIQPSQTRFHCFKCSSSFPDTLPGDYDLCMVCYPKLVLSRRISVENGPNGWRRCLQGHRMVILGFDDKHGGQRRLLVKDLVGGRCLRKKPCTASEFVGQELQSWSWGDGIHVRGDNNHIKLVTTDVKKDPPSSAHALGLDATFPPSGGVGVRAVANWGWYPADDTDDELLFPKGAEIREVKDVNGDWFHGTYMGKQGLFPSNYVRILDRGT